MNVTATSSAVLVDASRALASGEPLRALALAGRTDTALGLALRGIAYAQLGDLELARDALDRAKKTTDPLVRARVRAALVELDLEEGRPESAARAAQASIRELDRLGDARNAAMQRLVLARADVMLGRLDEARAVVEGAHAATLPPDVRAVAALAEAEIAVRAVAASDARDALKRARAILQDAPNQLLARALVALEEELSRPVARLLVGGVGRDADLFAIEAVSRGEVLLVDACRRLTLGGRVTIPLGRRPVLFALLLVLARAWPESIDRDALAVEAFEVKRVNASLRMRLRVEIGRLRKAMEDLGAEPVASGDGYRLASKRDVVVLLPPSDDDTAHIALLLGDGAAWSVRELAEHLGVSKSTAQRALQVLVDDGAAVRTGKGRDFRYHRPGQAIASRMLLLGLVPKP